MTNLINSIETYVKELEYDNIIRFEFSFNSMCFELDQVKKEKKIISSIFTINKEIVSPGDFFDTLMCTLGDNKQFVIGLLNGHIRKLQDAESFESSINVNGYDFRYYGARDSNGFAVNQYFINDHFMNDKYNNRPYIGLLCLHYIADFKQVLGDMNYYFLRNYINYELDKNSNFI